jgi:hypothetical protein
LVGRTFERDGKRRTVTEAQDFGYLPHVAWKRKDGAAEMWSRRWKMDRGAILDRLDKGPEYTFYGPVFESSERVWEKMRKVCGFSGGRDCGYATSFNKLPCAFDTCPLLKEEEKT